MTPWSHCTWNLNAAQPWCDGSNVLLTSIRDKHSWHKQRRKTSYSIAFYYWNRRFVYQCWSGSIMNHCRVCTLNSPAPLDPTLPSSPLCPGLPGGPGRPGGPGGPGGPGELLWVIVDVGAFWTFFEKMERISSNCALSWIRIKKVSTTIYVEIK